jgi:hypothetical protein
VISGRRIFCLLEKFLIKSASAKSTKISLRALGFMHFSIYLFVFICRLANILSTILGFPKYHQAWVEKEVFCRAVTEECRRGICEECSSGDNFFFKYPITADEEETVVSVPLWRKEENGYYVRGEFPMALEEAVKMFQESMPNFIIHHVTKKNQAALYKIHHENIEDDEMVIHFDFAENFSCSAQDQIQSAYYGQQMVSIFTVVMKHKQLGTKSVVLCCDETDHSKRAVMVLLLELFEAYVKPLCVNRVRFWSDGPSAQFKNKYMYTFLKFLHQRYELAFLQWNFFATSHGKGPVDGVGGTAKRIVWRRVMSRSTVVSNASDFVNVIRSSGSQIEALHISDLEKSFEDIRFVIEESQSVSTKFSLFIHCLCAFRGVFIQIYRL